MKTMIFAALSAFALASSAHATSFIRSTSLPPQAEFARSNVELVRSTQIQVSNGRTEFFSNVDSQRNAVATIPAPAGSNVNPGVGVSAIPEPASWAMLIGGFALVGTVARRRRTSVAV
jgi:PEP-CTERM motif